MNFRVSPEELALIEQKMSQLGTKNREAYLRKMALDGYVVQLDLPELKELVSLLRRSSNNLNQLTRRVHETGRVYDADLEDIAQRQEQLWEGVKEILTQLSHISCPGYISHLRRKERRSFRRAFLRFFFLSASLPFSGACRIIKADSKVFSHLTKELRYRC